jgi:transcription initiation factor TFIID subunit 7
MAKKKVSVADKAQVKQLFPTSGAAARPSANPPAREQRLDPKLKGTKKRLDPKLKGTKKSTAPFKMPGHAPGCSWDCGASGREKHPAIEEQFILRMLPGEDCEYLRGLIDSGKIDTASDVSIEFNEVGDAVLNIRGNCYVGVMMDLPCIIEANKTLDMANIIKAGDICQMLLITRPINKDKEKGFKDVKFEVIDRQYPHGLTPPMHGIRTRWPKKEYRNAKVDEEVERLMREDANAVSYTYSLESPEESGKVDIAGEKEGAEDDPAGSSKDAGSDLRGWYGSDSDQDEYPDEDAESRSSGFDSSKDADSDQDEYPDEDAESRSSGFDSSKDADSDQDEDADSDQDEDADSDQDEDADSDQDEDADSDQDEDADSDQDADPDEDAESRSSGFDSSKDADSKEEGHSQTRAVCGDYSGSDDENDTDMLSEELSAELFGAEPEVETPCNAQTEELANPEHAPTTAPHEAVTDAMTSQEDEDEEIGSPEAEVDDAAEERRAQKLRLLEEIMGLRRAIESKTLELQKAQHPILRQRFSKTLHDFNKEFESKCAELARLDLEG